MSMRPACSAAARNPPSVRRTTRWVASSVAASVINAIGNTIFHRTRPAPISALRAVIELAGPVSTATRPAPVSTLRIRAVPRGGSPRFQPSRAWPAVQRAANGGEFRRHGPIAQLPALAVPQHGP